MKRHRRGYQDAVGALLGTDESRFRMFQWAWFCDVSTGLSALCAGGQGLGVLSAKACQPEMPFLEDVGGRVGSIYTKIFILNYDRVPDTHSWGFKIQISVCVRRVCMLLVLQTR